jgi:hypothetical protein
MFWCVLAAAALSPAAARLSSAPSPRPEPAIPAPGARLHHLIGPEHLDLHPAAPMIVSRIF